MNLRIVRPDEVNVDVPLRERIVGLVSVDLVLAGGYRHSRVEALNEWGARESISGPAYICPDRQPYREAGNEGIVRGGSASG